MFILIYACVSVGVHMMPLQVTTVPFETNHVFQARLNLRERATKI